jgi:hypothetical protein
MRRIYIYENIYCHISGCEEHTYAYFRGFLCKIHFQRIFLEEEKKEDERINFKKTDNYKFVKFLMETEKEEENND